MAIYAYRAMRRDGTLTDGRLEAASRQAAFSVLDGQALVPVELVEVAGMSGASAGHGNGHGARVDTGAIGTAGGSHGQPNGNAKSLAPSMLPNTIAAPGAPALPGDAAPVAAATLPPAAPTSTIDRLMAGWRGDRVAAKVLEAFTRQLASLLRAGVPLAAALQLLAREATEPNARAHWQAVHDAVVDGTSLANAMASRPTVFHSVYVAMVQAGETGGFLDLVLKQIADFQNRDRELRGRVQAALAYPAVLALLSVAVLIYLMVFFIPRFQGIFADFGAALPPLTRAIVNTSVAMKTWGILALPVLLVGGVALRRYMSSDSGRLRAERILLRLPVFGLVAARFAMTRFCRMLGTLTHAGVPLITALRVARESIGNQVLSDAVTAAITRVQHGDRLGVSLADCRQLFPPSIVAMVSVAEQAGHLDEELIRIADESEQELDRHLRSAVSLAEPALLFIMAGFIGTIVIGMVLPIFTIQDYIK